MALRRSLFILWVIPALAAADPVNTLISSGRQADPTAKTLSDIRAAEKRRIPIEVQLKAAAHYSPGGSIDVTVIITNLFDAPLMMNSRMLVNHPLLQGELSFRIVDPSGKKVDIQRLITPLSVRDQDFVMLTRGQSIQRSVDLADLFKITRKGTYTIQVSYHNEVDHIGSRHPWKGLVWSEPVDIRLD